MAKGIKNPEFLECFRKNKIRKFSQGKTLVMKELNIARQDLLAAKESFNRDSFKWATIQAYYSMFHSARALLYSKNYREKSHYCLIVALKALYVEAKKLPINFIEALQKGKNLRENADYYDEWSQLGAENMINLAEEFLQKTHEILKAEQ